MKLVGKTKKQTLIDADPDFLVDSDEEEPEKYAPGEEVVKAARDAGVTMFFTRERHFFH